MKIVLFNVKYSPNLGDGLLSECLEGELRTLGGVEVESIDLAGRTAYGEGLRNRRTVIRILDASPSFLRHAMVRLVLGRSLRQTLRPSWRGALTGVDACIVGGGNLLSDQDLNFPLKVAAALREAGAAKLPVAVFGAGVSDNWSAEGQQLFESGFKAARLVHVAVRDDQSRKVWDRNLASAGLPKAEICRDPGVLAARHYPPQPRTPGPPTVALGLTDPLALRYHGGEAAVPDASLTEWFVDLVAGLAARGWRIRLFTNGSPEDRDYIARLAPQLTAVAPDQVSVVPTFERPADLAALASSSDLVLAHRLHACIAAYAYATPHLGFAWDPKLDAFFASVDRTAYIAKAGEDRADDVVNVAARALEEGIDPKVHARVIADAHNGVERAFHALQAAAEKA